MGYKGKVKGNIVMPEISISEDMYQRVSAFKELVEVVIEEEIDLDTCVELILGQGIDATLADLLSPLDPDTLLKSVQQLGSQHPAHEQYLLWRTSHRHLHNMANPGSQASMLSPLP